MPLWSLLFALLHEKWFSNSICYDDRTVPYGMSYGTGTVLVRAVSHAVASFTHRIPRNVRLAFYLISRIRLTTGTIIDYLLTFYEDGLLHRN
jgi:Na+-translocating ferredoxin:NAD+ oxidoreductase RnfE subunit